MRNPARLSRRGVRATLAGTVAVTALAISPLPAHADFTVARCAGTDIAGIGASFQAAAQSLFTEQFNVAAGCGGAPTITEYKADGSGAGRQALGEKNATTNPTQTRSATYRYAAADEAPNATQTTQIEKGEIDAGGQDLKASDDGDLHVIPVAVGATTIAVNYPDGCTLPPATVPVTPGNRLRLTAEKLEQVFAGVTGAKTWGDIVTGITESAGSPRAAGDCAALPIRRIVRFDDSGTTFGLKAWLNTVNGARGWTGSELGGTPNTKWPVNGANVPPTAGAGACTTDLCSNTVKGGGPLLDVMNLTDGSIGYADIKTARNKGYDQATSGDTSTYWMPIQNIAATGQPYAEPTKDPAAYLVNGTPGANCANATFSNLPADTQGNFSSVNGASSTSGYPLCALTYMLVWDDYAAVYGSSDTEQQKARTVKDYLDRVLSDTVQALLVSREYQTLPADLLTLARAGAAKVGWNKGATGTTPPPVATVVPTPSPAPSATAPVATPAPPSNAFSIDSARVSKKGVISLTLRLPGAGGVSAKATATKQGFTVGSAKGAAKAAGNLKVSINPSKKTKKALKKTKKLKVRLAVTFTPTGGAAASQSKTLTLKGKVVAKKKKKGKS